MNITNNLVERQFAKTMRIMKKIINILGAVVLCSALGSCNLMKSYELDTTPNFLGDITAKEYLETNRDTTLAYYYQAIEYAGMDDVIADQTPQTLIIPDNTAFRGIFREMGISEMEEVLPNVWKYLLEYLVLPEKYLSYEMEEGKKYEVTTLSGNRFYISRTTSTTDKYIMTINSAPSSDTDFAATPLSIKQQDMDFENNKVAHVVTTFPLFMITVTPQDEAPDIEPEPGVELKKVTVKTAGDAFVYVGDNLKNYKTSSLMFGERSQSGVDRWAYIRFEELPEIDFSETISSAQLCIYTDEANAGAPTSAEIHDISYFKQDDPLYGDLALMDIKEIDKNNYSAASGIRNPQNIIATVNGLTKGSWSRADITEFIVNRYNGLLPNDRAPYFCIRSLSGQKYSATTRLGTLNEDTGEDKNSAYIEILGPMPTDLEIVNNETLECPALGMATLTKDILSMSAESTDELVYTDNNIIYVLKELPLNGMLTKNGIPLKLMGRFSQEEIRLGLVRYFNGTEADDSFKVRAMDYAGGTLDDLIEVPVLIN